MSDWRSSDELNPLRALAVAIKREWVGGDLPPDARAAFDRHPEILCVKTVFLDLAYEEYCQRRRRGEAIDPIAFCARFPRHRSALLGLIETHLYLSDHLGTLPAVPPDPWPGAGEVVAGFTILRELGRGTFARVYLATEANAGNRPVAVKLTFEGGAEACILGRLTHPNVVHINSAGEDEGTGLTRLCMPYLGAATLHDVLRRAFPQAGAAPPARAAVILDAVAAAVEPGDPAPHIDPGVSDPPEVLRSGTYFEGVAGLGRQIADALAFVHRAGVYHRDLKPTNVLLAPGGRPVLLDFNLSNDGRFAAARLGGTLPYMAPEQVQALLDGGLVPPELDGRADLFSLGVVLYELLTGHLPFGPLPADLRVQGGGPILLDAQRVGCVPLRRSVPNLQPELARIVERCLAFRPEERPADAAEVRRALDDYLARARPAPRRLRRRTAAACAGALLAAGCVTLGLWWSHQTAGAGRGAGAPGESEPPGRVRVIEDPQSPGALFRQGRHLMLEGPDSDAAAIPVFLQAEKKRKADGIPPDGLTLACLSFCLARNRQNDAAVCYAGLARRAGLQTAAVFNNEGVARRQLGQRDDAYEAFSHAIDIDRGLLEKWRAPEPLINRGTLCLFGTTPTPRRLEEARADLDTAMKLGDSTGELHYQAALLAWSAKQPDEALSLLDVAVECGAPRRVLEFSPQFGTLRQHDRFLKLLNRADPSKPGFPPVSRLVDPMRGISD